MQCNGLSECAAACDPTAGVRRNVGQEEVPVLRLGLELSSRDLPQLFPASGRAGPGTFLPFPLYPDFCATKVHMQGRKEPGNIPATS